MIVNGQNITITVVTAGLAFGKRLQGLTRHSKFEPKTPQTHWTPPNHKAVPTSSMQYA
jgi:hypothetical protein